MPGNLFTAVTIRRRSAAHGCAHAHPDARSAGAVGTIKSASASCKISRLNRGLQGIKELMITEQEYPNSHLFSTW